MAAVATGADWSFPAGLPGAFEQTPQRGQDESPLDSAIPPMSGDTPPRQTTPQQEEPQPKRRRTHYSPRQCRICLEVVQPTFHYDPESVLPAALQPEPRVTYESEDVGRLLSPCKCKGGQRYVHEGCLSAWRMADPLQKRNYWECPTCRYRYQLQRLTWSNWISSTSAQIGLTLAIFLLSIFLLGFVADPIINMYLDPVNTIATAGGPTGSFVNDGEPATWVEHLVKGLASLGLLGFVKFFFSLSPFQWFNMRTGGPLGRSNIGGNGRDRVQQISWITIVIGLATFLYAVWKGVRAYVRKTLEAAGERVLDVPGDDDDDDDEED